MMRIDPSTTAKEANIRLRLGSGNNVLTQKFNYHDSILLTFAPFSARKGWGFLVCN